MAAISLSNSTFAANSLHRDNSFLVGKELPRQHIAGTLPASKESIVNDEKTFNREISAFDRIKDNYPKYLLTLDYDNTSINGIQKINVIDWLLESKGYKR